MPNKHYAMSALSWGGGELCQKRKIFVIHLSEHWEMLFSLYTECLTFFFHHACIPASLFAQLNSDLKPAVLRRKKYFLSRSAHRSVAAKNRGQSCLTGKYMNKGIVCPQWDTCSKKEQDKKYHAFNCPSTWQAPRWHTGNLIDKIDEAGVAGC